MMNDEASFLIHHCPRQAAVAARGLESQHTVNHSGGAAYAGPHGKSARRAVEGACSAFDAGVPVRYLRLSIGNFEHTHGTHDRAHGATRTCLGVEFQSHYVFKIDESAHKTSIR